MRTPKDLKFSVESFKLIADGSGEEEERTVSRDQIIKRKKYIVF